MRRRSGPKSGRPISTVLFAVPVLALVSRSGTVDLSSLSPGMVALAVGLVLSFLAPVVVSALLIATDGDTASDGQSTPAGRPASNERATDDERSMERGLSGNESSAATRSDRSIDTRRKGTRTRTERSGR